MPKVEINIKSSDINNFKDSDVLVYNKSKDYFYKTTAESFFYQYETKLNDLLKKYDEVVNELREKNEKISRENEELKEDNKKFKEKARATINDFIISSKEVNKKTIEMVEAFIREGGK